MNIYCRKKPATTPTLFAKKMTKKLFKADEFTLSQKTGHFSQKVTLV